MATRASSLEEKRQQILNAAVRVFADKGYHSARVGDIASEAGVAYGLVYHYFTSKEELLETIFRETWGQMLSAIKEVEEAAEPAPVQLRKVAAIVLRTWTLNPDLVRVLVREVTRSPHIQREVNEIEHAFEALERIVKRGQERGEFAEDLDSRLAAQIVYGALEEVLTGWVLGQLAARDEEEVKRAERTVTALLVDGLSRAEIKK